MVGEENMDSDDTSSPLSRGLFWIDCLLVLAMLYATVGAAPVLRESYDDLSDIDHHPFAAWLVSVDPLIFALAFSVLLAAFVATQYACRPRTRTLVARTLFFFEFGFLIVYVAVILSPIFHMH